MAKHIRPITVCDRLYLRISPPSFGRQVRHLAQDIGIDMRPVWGSDGTVWAVPPLDVDRVLAALDESRPCVAD